MANAPQLPQSTPPGAPNPALALAVVRGDSAAATWLTRREATEATFREIESQILSAGAEEWAGMIPGLEQRLVELKTRLTRLEKLIEQREMTAARRRLDAARGHSNQRRFSSSVGTIGKAVNQYARDRKDAVDAAAGEAGPSLIQRLMGSPAVRRIARLLFGPPAKPPTGPSAQPGSPEPKA